ncbi:MAG: FMN-binding glutamate synthase family protein [Deltaproteobacteria bacterium]|nr:FMN-binding glutamate synthase family protein [Deltaproteobacteria bacterium]MBW2361359.1 FMN-binding glutamate synthase family protein [Deltaproteobacteria bacterium]
MQMEAINQIVILAVFGLLLMIFLGPPVVLCIIYFSDRRQKQHAVLRNFPILGRLRYLLEHLGPEFRQYLFDGDTEGKPFTREGYRSIVLAGKYMKTLISFGSKRDFEEPGWYVRNAMLPTLLRDMSVDQEPSISTRRYEIQNEGLFTRKEHLVDAEVAPWTLRDEFPLTLGAGLAKPWVLRGLVGMSAMSYGALGRNAIQAFSQGLSMAGGTWLNTGEGGLSEHHLLGGGDILFQIGPGLFGVRSDGGQWSWDAFERQAAIEQVRGFELKFHQGAKIRGGHVEGSKVTPEIAAIRGVQPWQPINSPNRFPMFHSLDDALDHVARMRERGGKPVGLKMVIGGPGFLDELATRMAQRGDGPDWITVDGGEGGSGATYQEMADGMGLPIRSGIVEADDALRRHGVRERVRLIASGKLSSSDRIALALALGADAVTIARGLMISVGCIQAQRCHSNTCPVGVATTDERLMQALVVEEKKWRVLNYVVTLRAGLTSLAAAAGLRSPTQFERRHAVYRDAFGRIYGADELFPPPGATPG